MIMTDITIRDLSSSGTYHVERVISPTRVIILYPDSNGLFVFADLVEGTRWELSGGEPSPEERAILLQLETDAGTLDSTVTTVIDPGTPE
jgi:hypothetical protein